MKEHTMDRTIEQLQDVDTTYVQDACFRVFQSAMSRMANAPPARAGPMGLHLPVPLPPNDNHMKGQLHGHEHHHSPLP